MARGGPAIGSIQPGQADYYQMTRGGGTGDYHMIVYTPGNLQEACDLIQLAFDKADQYRNAVAVYVDGCIGQLWESVEIQPRTPDPKYQDKPWAATGWDGKSRPRPALPPCSWTRPSARHTTTTSRKNTASPGDGDPLQCVDTEDADIVVVAYGTTAGSAPAPSAWRKKPASG